MLEKLRTGSIIKLVINKKNFKSKTKLKLKKYTSFYKQRQQTKFTFYLVLITTILLLGLYTGNISFFK